nr:RecName: Full=Acharan sulfate lyase 1 [Bacteroides stercoris]
NYIYSGHNYHQ